MYHTSKKCYYFTYRQFIFIRICFSNVKLIGLDMCFVCTAAWFMLACDSNSNNVENWWMPSYSRITGKFLKLFFYIDKNDHILLSGR